MRTASFALHCTGAGATETKVEAMTTEWQSADRLAAVWIAEAAQAHAHPHARVHQPMGAASKQRSKQTVVSYMTVPVKLGTTKACALGSTVHTVGGKPSGTVGGQQWREHQHIARKWTKPRRLEQHAVRVAGRPGFSWEPAASMFEWSTQTTLSVPERCSLGRTGASSPCSCFALAAQRTEHCSAPRLGRGGTPDAGRSAATPG